jgi:hypothetical protein
MRATTILCAFLVAVAAWAADEINIQASMRVNNGDFSLTRSIPSLAVDQTGKNMAYGIQDLTYVTNTLTINTDVATGGYSWFRNIGTADVVVAVNMLLKASDVALLRVASTNITAYCVTSGQTSRVEYWVNEE